MSLSRGLHLHFDCVSGAAGDMTLGALFALGVPRDVVDRAVAAMGVEPDRITAEPVVKQGIAALDVKVRTDDPPAAQAGHPDPDHQHDDRQHDDHHHDDHHDHDHDHHPDHGHYPYAQIRERLKAAPLNEATRRLAEAIFARIARAEALLHGTTVDEVQFHEVGAIDSIVDVVGAAAAIAHLAPASVSCPSVSMGQGAVRCAHGLLPVPSPAAVEILREAGAVVQGGGLARELCTPTGAAILAEVVTQWTSCPPMTPVAIGYGAGDADFPDRPNVMRAMVGSLPSGSTDAVVVIEANIDDMSPEQAAYVAERLFEVGALDVWWSPIVMKKSRPGFQLGAIAAQDRADAVMLETLRQSTTLGVRYHRCDRRVLPRQTVEVETRFGRLPLVVASLPDGTERGVPEHEPCRRAASEHGVPLARVVQAAQLAFAERARSA